MRGRDGREIDWAISIDPGAVHCGLAEWRRRDGLWACEFAVEVGPDILVDYVKDRINPLDESNGPELVLIEGFWLKNGLDAVRQAGSQMETTEVIGTVKNLCRWAGMPFQKVANGQQATITRLTAAGYKWVSHGHGGHAKDAEAVGVRGLEIKVRQLAQLQAA